MITAGNWSATGRGIFADDGTHLAMTTHPRDVEETPDVKFPSYEDSIDNAQLMAASKGLLAACHVVLLYHGAARWSRAEASRWQTLIGSKEPATPKAMCDFIRDQVRKATPGDVV